MKNIFLSGIFAVGFGFANSLLINMSVENAIGKPSLTVVGESKILVRYHQIANFSHMAMPVSLFVSREKSIGPNYKWVGHINGIVLALLYFFFHLKVLSVLESYLTSIKQKKVLQVVVSLGVFLIAYLACFVFWLSPEIFSH